MAEGFRFVCDSCDRTIEAWSDGNPYYFDDDGKKQYAYHPEPRLPSQQDFGRQTKSIYFFSGGGSAPPHPPFKSASGLPLVPM